VTPADLGRVLGFLEALGCELPDRLEHPEPLLAQAARAAAQQALVEQRRERVELCLADRFRRLERAAAAEHRELREQAPLVVVE
jgi:hypothetical protein